MLTDQRLLEAYARYDATVEEIASDFRKSKSDPIKRKRMLRLFSVIKNELVRRGFSEDEIVSFDDTTGGTFSTYRQRLQKITRMSVC